MASLRVLAFDHEGRPLQFDTWLDDLQQCLLSDSRDSVSLCDHTSGTAPAPLATTDSATSSQWLTLDAAARLAIRNHLPLAECAHFGQHRTAQALYDAVVACYSLPATAALGRLLLPYLFPELDHFLALDPTALTVELLEQHLLVAETSAVAVGAARGIPRTPFFEGCSPSPLAPSYASAAAADVPGAEDIGAASTSAKRRSKGKGGRGGGGGSGVGSGGSSGGGGGSGGGGSGGSGGGSGGFGGGGGGSVGSGGSGKSGSGGSRTGAQRGGSGGGQRQQQQRRSETPSPQQLREWFAQRGASGGSVSCAAATLGASEFVLPGTALAEALHTFTLDSGASHRTGTGLSFATAPPSLLSLHLYRSGWLTPPRAHTAALQDAMVTTTAPGGQRVSICTCTRMGRHLATFTRRPGSSLYTLATEPSQTLLWHRRLGHPSLLRLRGMHSRLLVSGLPRSLPPLPHSPPPPCLPCVEGRQCTAPHSSLFPPTTAPLQTLHMDVWGPARVSGQGRERYFLLVVDDFTRYTTVFPLRSKGQVVDVSIPWICTVHLHLHERFRTDLPDLCLHSDRGGEFSSDLLQDFCRGEGILQSFTLLDSPQQNGIAEHRIGLVMEVARTSMIHAAAPHFLWPFAVRYAAHQLNLWPRVSLPETSPIMRWTGKVGDASVFWVWDSHAFVRDTYADKLSARAIPCVFLGFYPNAPGWQFYHPTLRLFPSQDVTFDESVLLLRLFPYRSAPPPPQPLFLARDPLPGTAPVEVAVGSGAAPGAASGGAASWGAEPGGAKPGGAGSGGAEPEGAELEGAGSEGAEPGGAEPESVEPGDTASEGGESGGAEPRVSAAGDTGDGGARVTTGAGGTGGGAAAGPGGARAGGTGAAGTGGVGGAGAGDPTEPGAAGAGGAGAVGAGTAFLQGSLHEEIWLRRPPGFIGSFPAGTQWSLCSQSTVFARRLVLQGFSFHFSLPQPTPLSTSHSLSAPPSDESVEPSGPYPELVGCLMYLMMCTCPDLAYPLSLLARYMAPDNKAMIALCQEHRLESRMKHIARRYFLARKLQQRGQLRLAYVATWANIADIFSKALPPSDHQRFSTVLGLVPTLPHLLSA
ncbi:unnamed protein product [Closterium sp. NIES-53]